MCSIEFKDLPLGTVFTIYKSTKKFTYVKVSMDYIIRRPTDLSTVLSNAYCFDNKHCICFVSNIGCVVKDCIGVQSAEFKYISRYCVLLDFERGVHEP